MKTALATSLALALLLAGCSASTRRAGGEAARIYTNNDLHVSFRVPAGWTEPSSWGSLQKARFAARFDSPTGEAAIILGQGTFAGINCPAAASAALRAATGATFASTKEFTVATSSGELPAGRGETSVGNRAGEARYFCHGESAVVLDVSVPWQDLNRRRAELDAIVDTLTSDVGGEPVAVRAPAPPPPAPTFFVHTVKFHGQTLGRISEWYTGSFDNWRKLSRVNNDLSVPNVVLKIGREVKIPTEIVVRQEPLPEPKKKHVARKASRGETKSAGEGKGEPQSPSAGENEEAPALPPVIGPR